MPTRIVDEGDVIDLGDRAFEVLSLPGHTPGSIGLWDEADGTLFCGDVVYAEDPLIDQAPTSDVQAYLATMRRLRDVPVRIVHAGHDRSMDPSDDAPALHGVPRTPVGVKVAPRCGSEPGTLSSAP